MFSFIKNRRPVEWYVFVSILGMIVFVVSGTFAAHDQYIANLADKAVACTKELGPENALLCREIYQLPAKP